jgi:nitrous oxide reductase accessory protein NosL
LLVVGATFTCAATKVEPPAECAQCGMNRTAFAHSRALVEYQDGRKSGTCSINCAIVELNKNPNRKLKSLKVADFGTKKLIGATTAFWVIGGNVDGVMTPVPKWAFARNLDAQLFVKEYGGWLAPYKEVSEAVKEEILMREQDKRPHQHKL